VTEAAAREKKLVARVLAEASVGSGASSGVTGAWASVDGITIWGVPGAVTGMEVGAGASSTTNSMDAAVGADVTGMDVGGGLVIIMEGAAVVGAVVAGMLTDGGMTGGSLVSLIMSNGAAVGAVVTGMDVGGGASSRTSSMGAAVGAVVTGMDIGGTLVIMHPQDTCTTACKPGH
jgi:hypothetical protein